MMCMYYLELEVVNAIYEPARAGGRAGRRTPPAEVNHGRKRSRRPRLWNWDEIPIGHRRAHKKPSQGWPAQEKSDEFFTINEAPLHICRIPPNVHVLRSNVHEEMLMAPLDCFMCFHFAAGVVCSFPFPPQATNRAKIFMKYSALLSANNLQCVDDQPRQD